MRGLKLVMCGVLLVAATGVAAAAGFEKGGNLLAVQLTHGDVTLVGPIAGGYITAYPQTELGVQVSYWRFLTNDYAFNVSGGLGFFSETDKPGQGAPPDAPDFKYTQSSWNVRVGGDRVAKLNDRFHVFAGPGLQFWSGHGKADDGVTSTDWPTVSRFAIEARVGVHLSLSDNVALLGQIGHYIGYASAEDHDAKATWWPSGHDGSIGIAFGF